MAHSITYSILLLLLLTAIELSLGGSSPVCTRGAERSEREAVIYSLIVPR